MKEKIFFCGDDYFNALINDIEHANKSIELESYIFAIDSLGKKIIDVLTNAAKRGLKIKILVDGAGTPNWQGQEIEKLECAGAKTRIFRPFPWRLWQMSRSYVKAPTLLKLIYLCLNINRRNHRKVCTIDKKIVYIGSYNISKNHLDKNHNGNNWRDTGVRLESINPDDINDLTQAFVAAWNHMPIKDKIKYFFRYIHTNPIIRLNNTRHRRRILYKNLLRRIKSCKTKIWITNAYFVPDNFLLRRLKEAAHKGVDVRILLPQHSDVIFMPWASKTFYYSLLKAGVRIFEYQPNILHAKTLIIDDWLLIGSSNLNHRSLRHDLEVDVNICTPWAKNSLSQQFLLDLEQSKEIFLSDWQKRPWYQNLVGKLILYVKYWL